MPTEIPPPEGLHELQLRSLEDAVRVWDKFREVPSLFDDFTRGNQQRFLQGLMSPDSIWLETDDGNGILYLTGIVPGLHAYAHMAFWDRKLRGREPLVLQTLKWAVITLNLVKIETWIPDFARVAVHFAQRVGFTEEGRIRRYSYSDGKLFDEVVLGMTREEVLDGPGIVLEPQHTGTASKLVSESIARFEQLVQRPAEQDDEAAEPDGTDLQPPADGRAADGEPGAAIA